MEDSDWYRRPSKPRFRRIVCRGLGIHFKERRILVDQNVRNSRDESPAFTSGRNPDVAAVSAQPHYQQGECFRNISKSISDYQRPEIWKR